MKLYILIILGLFCSGNFVFGQAALSNTEISWSIPEAEDTTGLSEGDLVYIMKEFHAEMQVSEDVKEIQVKMGPVQESEDFFGRIFSLIENVEFEDGSAISIDGADVDIRLGYFQGLRSFKLRLIALNNAGGVIGFTDMQYP